MNAVCFVRVGLKTYRMFDLEEQVWAACFTAVLHSVL